MRGIRAEGKFVMGLYQFLKAVPQHNSVRPCWEAGGWQRRKGYLRGDALNKRQRDTALLLAQIQIGDVVQRFICWAISIFSQQDVTV